MTAPWKCPCLLCFLDFWESHIWDRFQDVQNSRGQMSKGRVRSIRKSRALVTVGMNALPYRRRSLGVTDYSQCLGDQQTGIPEKWYWVSERGTHEFSPLQIKSVSTSQVPMSKGRQASHWGSTVPLPTVPQMAWQHSLEDCEWGGVPVAPWERELVDAD